jgi:copper chaperone CopZ
MGARVWLMSVAALVVAPGAAAATPAVNHSAGIAAGTITKLHLHVEGIACDSCSKRLRDALTKLQGVVSVAVDREHAALAVDFDSAKTSEQVIRTEVAAHGFTAK